MAARVEPVESAEASELPTLGGVLDFMRLMWQVDHALQRASKRMEQRLGVTGPQRLVLRILGRFPGIPAGHVARLLHVHPSTLTGVLKRLSQTQLIRRRHDPRDRRRQFLSLTDRGREIDTARAGTIEAVMAATLDALPAEKVANTREVLAAIAERLSQQRDLT